MEFSSLLRIPEKSRFARYTIQSNSNSYTREEDVIYSKNGFYYIGKNSTNIEKLVRVLKRGYASDLIENAKSELKRSLTQEKNAIPEVIFCESHFDPTSIKSLRFFLNTHPLLSSIPFVLDAPISSRDKLNMHKKAGLADEIMFLQETEEKNLKVKIQFLKKVKMNSAKISERQQNKMQMNMSFHFLLKRAFDIMISALALCLLSPIFLLIALAIKIESRGPVFYISKRAGRGYQIFDFYKFRTMFVNADKNIDEYSHLNQYKADSKSGPLFIKIKNDPRVTKVGAFLRNTSLDELPQLINVFLGNMSLVGNRPLPLYEAATLTTDDWAARFMAPAGMTGLWQIKKRGQRNMSVQERISLDIAYANKNNFIYDLWIMANTPYALLQKENV
jgi:lipopolysaccharide/colanic/teichoic acid biosynthesis glycosyltransferase